MSPTAPVTRLMQATATSLTLPPAEAGDQAALCVDVPMQQQDEWCWCAVTVGIAGFYDRAFGLSQCQTAAQVLGISDACSRPDADDVDVQFALEDALGAVGHLDRMESDPLAFDRLVEAIDTEHPVCARIRRVDGEGHFVVIRGYRRLPIPTLLIDDPAGDTAEPPYDEFLTHYQGDGVWKQSYLTR